MSRAWLITDTHLGIKNSSSEWFDIHEEFFYKWFIPLLKKEYKEGDILIHLGDVFDSRTSINLKVLNLSIKIFSDLSLIFKDGIHIICGNHDIFAKSSNEVNSLKPLNLIKNIKIYESPESIYINNKKLHLIPWFDLNKDVMNEIKNNLDSNAIFCHTDFKSVKFNKWVDTKDGVNLEEIQGIKRIYSGHLHYSQKKGPLNLLGCPYQLNRGDIDNKKGVTLLDLNTFDEIFYENTLSPIFLRIKYKDILAKKDLSFFNNNFVDLLIEKDDDPKIFIDENIELINNCRKFIVQPIFTDDGIVMDTFDFDDSGNVTLVDLMKKYIDNTSYDDTTKEKLYNSLIKIYNRVKEGIS